MKYVGPNALAEVIRLVRTESGGRLERTIMLPVADWSSNNTRTVTCAGVTTTNTIIVAPSDASYEEYCDCMVRCTAQGTNSLTFKCDSNPSVAITVNVLILT